MKVKKTCPICGTEFTTVPSSNVKYCCRECAWQAQRKGSARHFVCLQCGNAYSIRSGHAEQKFCCRKCYIAWNRKNGGLSAPVNTSAFQLTVNDIVFRTRSGSSYEYWADFNTGF